MPKAVKQKNYCLDETKIKQAQRVLGMKTETETVQQALELVVNEARLAQTLKNLLDNLRKGKDISTIQLPKDRKIIFDTNIYIEAIHGDLRQIYINSSLRRSHEPT